MRGFGVLWGSVVFFIFSCKPAGPQPGLLPPSGLDYGRTPVDSLRALSRWLEGQRGVAAETMQVRVLTAWATKILNSAPDTAQVLLERAQTLWQELANRYPMVRSADFMQIKLDIFLRKCRLIQRKGNQNEAMQCYHRCFLLADSLGALRYMANALEGRAGLYKARSEYDSAMVFYQQALLFYEKLDDKKLQARTLEYMGSMRYYQANYPESIEYYQRALKIYEELGDRVGQANCLNNIGNIYVDQQDYSRALEYYQQALQAYKETGNEAGQASSLANIGIIYQEKKDYSRSLECFQQALQLFQKLGDKNGLAICLNNIANAYMYLSYYGQALNFYHKALRLYKELGNKRGQGLVLANLGSIYARLDRYSEAERFLLAAIRIDSSIGALKELMEGHLMLSLLYEGIGDTCWRRGELKCSAARFRQAITALKRGMTLKDTLFNEESRKQLIRKELAYEYEKKRLEERARHETQMARQEGRVRQQRLVIGSITVLLIVTAGFLWRVNRQRQVIAAQKRIVEEQKAVVERQKELVEEQRELLAQKNQEIEQSIRYARRIQEAILPSMERWNSVLPENFVLYWPRDIVAGDFYWLGEAGGYVFVAVADCTGHGVPGAMMSVLCSGALSRAVLEEGVVETGLVLDRVREEVVARVHWGDVDLRDGMDGVLLRFCRGDWLRVQFSGANQGMWIVRPNGELIEVEGDMQPVGYAEWSKPFGSQDWVLEPGSMVYLFTDGYVDQFGGTSGKKLGRKRLREWVREVYREPCEVQRERLAAYFEAWRGGLPQVDDVTVVGLRVG